MQQQVTQISIVNDVVLIETKRHMSDEDLQERVDAHNINAKLPYPMQETKRSTHVVSSKEGPLHRRAMLHAMLELAQDIVMDLNTYSERSDPNQTKMDLK